MIKRKRKDVFIAGLTRISDMPLGPVMVAKFAQYVDYLVLSFDGSGDYSRYNRTNYIDALTWYELFKRVRPFPNDLPVNMFVSKITCGAQNMNNTWLEEMLRRLDDVKPDFVLECESDASFDYGPDFDEDVENFINSNADMWIMNNTCPKMEEGRDGPHFPRHGHCRGYRWFPGVYYRGGFCKIWPPDERGFVADRWKERPMHVNDVPPTKAKLWTGKTKFQHYCIFSERLERERWEYYGRSRVERLYEVDNQFRKRFGDPELPLPDLDWMQTP